MRQQVRSLGQTEIYRYLNNNDSMTKAMLETYLSGKKFKLPDFGEAFDRISRYSYPLKNAIINRDYESIRITFNEGAHKVPPFLPAYTISIPKGPIPFVTVADITQFSTMNKEGKVRITDKDLYAILTQAYLTHYYYIAGANRMRNLGTSTPSIAKCYGLLMIKVFNRLFGLSTNSVHMDKVMYCIYKFFYLNVLGYEMSTEELNEKCILLTETQNKRLVRDIDNYMGDDDYKTLEGFMAAIAKNIPVCAKLTLGGFINSFTAMYGTGSIFAIEFLPTLLTLIVFVVEGNYLTINTSSVEKVIDKEAPKAYNSIMYTIKSGDR